MKTSILRIATRIPSITLCASTLYLKPDIARELATYSRMTNRHFLARALKTVKNDMRL
jgi:hypothetical protein